MSLHYLLDIIDAHKESMTDKLYIDLCHDIKQKFQLESNLSENGGSGGDNEHDNFIPVLSSEQEILGFSDLYIYLILCLVEQRGNNSICGLSLDSIREATMDDRELVLYYINSITDRFYFLDRMKYDIPTLQVCQTRDCQTFQTGNHYVALNFRTLDENRSTYYNLKFTSKFKDQFVGNRKITISYSTDTIVKKNQKHLHPHPVHTIGIDSDTSYHRINIFSTTVDTSHPIISNLPAKYLIGELREEEYKLKIKREPDTCTIQ